ncbi:hypothetical protein [Citrifermentans bemidjiense]|nr:hypothetical protein [Citrifermentans bemidjiense]
MTNQTDSIERALVAASAWLVEHGFQLNNREWASLILIGVLAAWLLPQPHIRHSIRSVIRSAMSPKLLIIWISYVLWIALFVFLAQWQCLWDQSLTKDTVVWAVTVGFVSLAGFTDAHKPGFFSRAVWKTAGISVLMEYLVNLSAFPLFVEIILQPVIIVFSTAPVLIKTSDEKKKWQGWSSRFFLILAAALLGNTAISLSSAWDSIDFRLFVLRAGWPVGLGLWVLLLVFLWSLVSSYEQAFIRLELARPDPQGVWKVKAGLVLGLGPNLEWIHRAAKGGTHHIARTESVWATVQAAREFKHEQLAKKKAEQSYQADLKRFAGNPDVDEQGRPVDKREFRETREALDWLHTCHMGWFRHAPTVYKHELLDRIGDDFTRQGLQIPSGIVMEVADDGTKWYAWRRTIGGHHFAIGANGDPPNQWRYDGRNPPTGFPGIAPEWGKSPFEADVAPNWHE